MTFLCVFAHPDDEAYGPAGTIAHLIAHGAQGYLLTLTQGGAGTLGICKDLPVEQKKRMRSRELACAARTLGFKQHFLLDLPDGGLSSFPSDEGIALIGDFLHQINPQMVFTFHDGGISGHPDHITTSRWVFNAMQQWAGEGELYYYGMSEAVVDQFPDRRLVPMKDKEIKFRVDVSTTVAKKVAAIHCHQSQLELWHRLQQGKGDYLQLIREEVFALPYSSGNQLYLTQYPGVVYV